jgi:hypothetical protein
LYAQVEAAVALNMPARPEPPELAVTVVVETEALTLLAVEQQVL